MLNVISLQMFQNKMKISPPVLPVSLGQPSQIFKKMCSTCPNMRISDKNGVNIRLLDGPNLIGLRNV